MTVSTTKKATAVLRAVRPPRATRKRARTTRSKHPCALRNTRSCKLTWVGDRQALVTWAAALDTEWSLFQTHTFRHPIPARNAMNAGASYVRWCIRWCDPVLHTPLFRLSLWSAESHATGNVHVHAISVCTPLTCIEHYSRRPSDVEKSSGRVRPCRVCSGDTSSDAEAASRNRPLWWQLKESWYAHHGIARVYPYDRNYKLGAEGYVMKYILDDRCLDWGIVIG